MNQDNTFSYKYSAKENKEIQEIRNKYLPQSESKLEELKRLDNTVQNSGSAEALCVGTAGTLVFGLGMSLVLNVFGESTLFTIAGALLGLAGLAGICVAYHVHCKIFERTKAKYSSRILELTAELSGEKI